MVSTGEYGVTEGLVCSVPVRCVEGEWEVVRGLTLTPAIQVSDEMVTQLNQYPRQHPYHNMLMYIL